MFWKTSPYDAGLAKNRANFTALTPLDFLARAAAVHPRRMAVVHGRTGRDWASEYERCRRLASALVKRGIKRGDTVAVLAPNIPALFEAHFGVPMAGAVLCALNTRLDAPAIAYILEHGEAKAVLVDREYAGIVRAALTQIKSKPLVVDIADPEGPGHGFAGERIGEVEYEKFLSEGDPTYAWQAPADEWEAIALNYTSGTTGNPKGVVYHHRGAYLNAIGNILVWSMPKHPVLLWTLPMFHCNGWVEDRPVTALAGTHVCLRRVEAGAIFDAIAERGITHLCGAPVVLNMLINAPAGALRKLDRRVAVMTAASAPPPSVLETIEGMGFDVTHVYGLTEVYGPSVVCDWHEEWSAKPAAERAAIKARQGVRYPVLDGLMVADPQTMKPVPADGKTIGEVFMRGNIVMKGYFKNPGATAEALKGGWFHTGDLGVEHPDGYIELKDRSKDIIKSGGESVSTIEVEAALYRHPGVLEAAVVGRPDAHWGETPCAFVTLKDGATTTEIELLAFCRTHMAHFKVPKTVVFGPLPKTATGKIQKFVLREKAKAL